MKHDSEFYKEKSEQLTKSYAEAVEKIKEQTEAVLAHESERAELEAKLKIATAKNLELNEVVSSNEGRRVEIELNLEKLMAQLK